MPRVNGVYQLPPGSYGAPNTTIQSNKYNTLIDDLASEANGKRPIGAGGTGASSAVEANDALNTISATMASAATLNLANATGVVVNVTGTTTITALGTVSSGAERVLVFAAALTLTHNATSLMLPGGADITTAAGDVATFRSKGAGNWVCVSYQRASGGTLTPVVLSAAAGTLFTFESQDPGAASGPDIDLYRNSASPAASDLLASLLFNGKDSAAAKKQYAAIRATVVSPTAGAEASDLALRSIVAGTLADRMHVRGGAYMEGATGGDPGAGKFNATELQVNGKSVTAILHLQDQKPSGTAGGAFTSGAWQTRTLNTKVADEIGSTLSSNQFTLPAGTYEIRAMVPGFRCVSHKAKLYNVTDASDVLIGSATIAEPTVNVMSTSLIAGRFTLAGSKTLAIQHQCSSTRATDGFGSAAGFSSIEIYSDVIIRRVA